MNAPLTTVKISPPENRLPHESEIAAKRMDITRGGADPLIALDRFSRMLAESEALDEVTDIRSRAEAVRTWIKSAALGLELQNRAAELKLRAERKAGKLLSDLKLRGGDRKSTQGEDRLKLADFGISQNQSKRWQKEAAIPEDEFLCYVRSASQLGEEVTTAGLLRLSPRTDANAAARSRPEPQGDDSRQGFSQSACPVCHGDEEPHDDACGDLHHEFPDVVELIREIKDHHALLTSLLEPLYEGRQESLLPGQRRGVRHYLSEVGRLLTRLVPDEAVERKRA